MNFFRLLGSNKEVWAVVGVAGMIGVPLGLYSASNNVFRYSVNLDKWDDKWKNIRNNNSLPIWDNGSPTKATEYLNDLCPELPPIRDNKQIRTYRVFVPLCGASTDLKYIGDWFKNKVSISKNPKNYKLKIIGIDSSSNAIEYFMDKIDDRPEYIKSDEDNFPESYQMFFDEFSKIPAYKSNPYYIINSDIFHASSQRLILRADCIYDNNSLSFIPPNLRKKYVNLISKIIRTKGKILLTTYNFDSKLRNKSHKNEPPYPLNRKDLLKLFNSILNGNELKLILLDSQKWSQSSNEHERSLSTKFGINGDGTTDVWLIESQKEQLHFV